MGINIEGWLEITRFEREEQNQDYAWTGLLSLGAVIDSCDEISEVMFGFSRRALIEGLPFTPVAKERGLPSAYSQQVIENLKRIKEHELKHGEGEYFGNTYIYYHQIKEIDWNVFGVENIRESNWNLVFKILQIMETDCRFDSQRIRLVAWVCW